MAAIKIKQRVKDDNIDNIDKIEVGDQEFLNLANLPRVLLLWARPIRYS